MRIFTLVLALLLATGNASDDTAPGPELEAALETSADPGAADAIQTLVDKGEDARAIDLAREASARGDARAQEWLGWLYDNGRGAETDFVKAAKHYRIAGESGRNYARWRLGVMIDDGKIEGSLEEAVSLFKAAAANNFTNAMVSLAVMQATGRGTPVDYDGALQNYSRAARAGNAHGIQGIGVLYALGQGVARDPTEAGAWFLVSAAQGNEVGSANFERETRGMSDEDMVTVTQRAQEISDELGFDTEFQQAKDAPSPG